MLCLPTVLLSHYLLANRAPMILQFTRCSPVMVRLCAVMTLLLAPLVTGRETTVPPMAVVLPVALAPPLLATRPFPSLVLIG